MISIKEEFYSHPKAKRAVKLGGADALLLWHQMKAYASNGGNGFIPEEAIEDFPLPVKNLKKCLVALVDSGVVREDGSRGPGLIVRVEFGFQLHDYLDHAYSSDELGERKARDREKKRHQRASAKVRTHLIENGMSTQEADKKVRDIPRDDVAKWAESLKPVPRDNNTSVPGQSREQSRGQNIDSPRDVPGGVPLDCPAGVPLAAAGAGVRVHAGTRPSPAQPSPAQPSPLKREREIPPRPPWAALGLAWRSPRESTSTTSPRRSGPRSKRPASPKTSSPAPKTSNLRRRAVSNLPRKSRTSAATCSPSGRSPALGMRS